MAINAADLLKTAFGGLKTDVGKKLVGLFFVVQLFNFAGSMLAQSGAVTGATTAGLLATLVATVLGIIATIGGLRGFREGELDREMFTDNLVWPFGKILGANLTTTIFAYGLALLIAAPTFIVIGLSGTSVSNLTGASLTIIGLGGLGVLLGVGVFFYVLVSLILSQPLIAIEDRRMFQALDESIQRTRNHRVSIFFAVTGLIAVYLLASVISVLAASFAGETVAGAVTTLVVAPVMTPVSLCLLNELTEELPEAE
jgi:hypothetical protein